MDLGHPWALFSGMMIGLIGIGLLMHGRKSTHVPSIVAGVTMCAFPYFMESAGAMWLVAAACLGGLYAANRLA